MKKVYITGHRNPDIDSICSAYAYAKLKNAIDSSRQYVAVRCGHISDNVKAILETLELSPLEYMSDVHPKVGDVVLTAEQKIEGTARLHEIAAAYGESNPSVIPVYKDGSFCGLLSVDDITAWVMREMLEKEKIDVFPTVEEIMGRQEEPVLATELFEEVKQKLSMSEKRGLAVFDENGYLGYVTRRCFLKAPKYNVILVDHNEIKQSIKGIEEANILEVIDHHRLDAVKTELPVFIDAEPLGSTCTIVYQLYLRHGIMPDTFTAKTLLAGIISDTVRLKSPTTTQTDKISAGALSALCGVNLDEFGKLMFANTQGLKSRDPVNAISSDFKTYTEKGVNIGIGQCEVTSLQDLAEYSQTYLEALEQVREQNRLDWAALMITDILTEHSVLLCTEYKLNKYLQYQPLQDRIYDMPGILSRKKQLLPELLSVVDFYL